MLEYRNACVLRAGRCKPTLRWKSGGDESLIEAYREGDDVSDPSRRLQAGFRSLCVPVLHRSVPARSRASSAVSLVIPRSMSPQTCCRVPFATRAGGPVQTRPRSRRVARGSSPRVSARSGRACRQHSRIRRRIRLRSTALPCFLPTMKAVRIGGRPLGESAAIRYFSRIVPDRIVLPSSKRSRKLSRPRSIRLRGSRYRRGFSSWFAIIARFVRWGVLRRRCRSPPCGRVGGVSTEGPQPGGFNPPRRIALPDCGHSSVVRPRTNGVAGSDGYRVIPELTVRRLRPFARRRASTFRPLWLDIRSRKPCLLRRFRLLGWNVRFIAHLSGKILSLMAPPHPCGISAAVPPR